MNDDDEVDYDMALPLSDLLEGRQPIEHADDPHSIATYDQLKIAGDNVLDKFVIPAVNQELSATCVSPREEQPDLQGAWSTECRDIKKGQFAEALPRGKSEDLS